MGNDSSHPRQIAKIKIDAPIPESLIHFAGSGRDNKNQGSPIPRTALPSSAGGSGHPLTINNAPKRKLTPAGANLQSGIANKGISDRDSYDEKMNPFGSASDKDSYNEKLNPFGSASDKDSNNKNTNPFESPDSTPKTKGKNPIGSVPEKGSYNEKLNPFGNASDKDSYNEKLNPFGSASDKDSYPKNTNPFENPDSTPKTKRKKSWWQRGKQDNVDPADKSLTTSKVKKPLYKKWQFWAVVYVVVMVLSVIIFSVVCLAFKLCWDWDGTAAVSTMNNETQTPQHSAMTSINMKETSDCQGVTCGTNQECVNVDGARCRCIPGYGGMPCDDIDECKTDPCEHSGAICENNFGSYTCFCNGFECTDVLATPTTRTQEKKATSGLAIYLILIVGVIITICFLRKKTKARDKRTVAKGTPSMANMRSRANVRY